MSILFNEGQQFVYQNWHSPKIWWQIGNLFGVRVMGDDRFLAQPAGLVGRQQTRGDALVNVQQQLDR